MERKPRLDAAAIRKRAASKSDVIVEVKPGEEVTSLNVGWMVEMYVTSSAKAKKAESVKDKKPVKKKKQ